MSDLNDILNGLDIDGLAAQLGADPADVRAAAEQAVPTLVAGVAAKSDEGEDVDAMLSASRGESGDAMVHSLFGDDGDGVAGAVGDAHPAAGVDQSLVKRLLPLLAPIVLNFVLSRMSGGGGTNSAGGGLGDILGGMLGGGAKPGGMDLGSVLGGVLGGGKSGGGDNPLGGILGSILGGK